MRLQCGPIVEAREITRVFPMPAGPVTAVHGVSLRIEPAEYVAIWGPSGCGKSTLLHILGCVDTPSSGALLFENRDVSSLPDADRSDMRLTKIGFVFQRFFLLPMLTAWENVELPQAEARIAREARRPSHRGAAGICRPRASRAPPPLAALGWGNAAGRHRPRAGQSPGAPAGRRADRRAGSRDRRADRRALRSRAAKTGRPSSSSRTTRRSHRARAGRSSCATAGSSARGSADDFQARPSVALGPSRSQPRARMRLRTRRRRDGDAARRRRSDPRSGPLACRQRRRRRGDCELDRPASIGTMDSVERTSDRRPRRPRLGRFAVAPRDVVSGEERSACCRFAHRAAFPVWSAPSAIPKPLPSLRGRMQIRMRRGRRPILEPR